MGRGGVALPGGLHRQRHGSRPPGGGRMTTHWHLVTSEYPPDIGGVSDYTGQLARALADAGDDVHVWCPGAARAHVPGVRVHAALGTLSPADLRRADTELDACPGPRRLLVQWVPHGFGYRSMNLGF